MQITLNEQQSRFETRQDGSTAIAEFNVRPGVLTVTHVIVPPTLRGGGVASALAAHVVEYARRENLKIEPQCSFMAAYLQKHPETHDLVK